MASENRSTVYFDGACALCRAEIGLYRREDKENALVLVDVSKDGSPLPAGVTKQQALSRFHVRGDDGRLHSGAAAFIHVWSRLPRWRWAARAASRYGVARLLEAGYRLFLPVRPLLSHALSRIQQFSSSRSGEVRQ